MRDIKDLRLEINEIDEKLAKLLERRMSVARGVGEYKKSVGMPIFDSAREEEVLKRNTDRVENEELKPYVREIFQDIMNVSKEYQKKVIGEDNE